MQCFSVAASIGQLINMGSVNILGEHPQGGAAQDIFCVRQFCDHGNGSVFFYGMQQRRSFPAKAQYAGVEYDSLKAVFFCVRSGDV